MVKYPTMPPPRAHSPRVALIVRPAAPSRFCARVGGAAHVPIFARFFGCFAICIALVVGTTERAFARPFSTDSTANWEGCGALVALARQTIGAPHVKVQGTLDYAALTPNDAVLIVHPERTLDVGSLSRFMKAGGRVLLFDDFGTGDSLLEHFGMGRIPAPEHPAQSLRNNAALPLAEPASSHPTVADVTRVALNHPTALRHPNLSPVLKIRANDGDDVIVAVAGTVKLGRLLAVSDASIVIDDMLRYGGNRSFAEGVVRYAIDEDAWGKRGGILYIVTGDFEQKGRFGDDDSVASSLDEAFRSATDMGRSIQRDGLPPAGIYVASLLLGVFVLAWIGKRSTYRYKHRQPSYATAVPLARQGGLAGRHALLSSGHAPRLLVALEWKLALEAELRLALGERNLPPPATLPERLVSEGLLPAEAQGELRALLLEFSQVETRLIAKGRDLREREVESLSARTTRVLDAIAKGTPQAAR